MFIYTVGLITTYIVGFVGGLILFAKTVIWIDDKLKKKERDK
jgi:hypothetical protein